MKYPDRIEVGIEHVSEVTSTNEHLAQLCNEGKAQEFYTLITDYQTAGKGQRGNIWESEKGKNLLFSIALYPTALEANKQFYLSMLASISIVDALRKYTDGFTIKWPNDIYWNDQKIGGILIENELQGKYITRSIIGIGLNINQETFHSDAPNPVSLKQIIGVELNCYEIFDKILQGIVASYRLLEIDFEKMSETLSLVYKEFLYRRREYHYYKDAKGNIFKAKFVYIEPNGRLYLMDEQTKIRKYRFKEVEYIIP